MGRARRLGRNRLPRANPACGTLLFSERATQVLGDLLLASGYFLDTILPTQTRYRIFICEHEIDALDRERSEIVWFEDEDNINYVLRHSFHSEALRDEHVFRLRYLRATVLVSDTFVRRAEEHQLTGFHLHRALVERERRGAVSGAFSME